MRLHLSHVACLVVLGGPAWAQVPVVPVPGQAVPSIPAPQKIDKFDFKFDSEVVLELKKEAERLVGQAALLTEDVRAEVEMALQAAQVQIETNIPSRPGGPVRVVVGGDAYTNPASLQDADIKLLAIQGLQNQKSPNVVPLLEGVLTATHELEVKKRALYVLALNEEPQAHQVLLRYAKGGGNPDLQVEAIRRLGSRGDGKTTSSAEMREIYEGTSDANVKMAVIDALRSSMSKDALIAIASAPRTSAEVRGRAISSLSGVANPADVMAMYQKETDRNLKLQMVNVLGSMRAADQLAQIARTEKDTAVRQRAIRSLGSTRVESARQMLVELYAAEQDKDTRKVIINIMADQNNAEGLIALGRKETAPDVKLEIVRRLSDMARSSKPAADYMAELLK